MTDAIAEHPAAERLEGFALGRLAEPDREQVERHVAGCPACCAALAHVRDDTLLQLARDAATQALLGNVPPAAPQPVAPPELVGHSRYRVVALLGKGGMGTVYKAEHKLMKRTVALKVINRSLMTEPGAVERFRREIEAAAALDHPNIVRAHDAEQAGDLHFLVTEFIEGTDLARLVAKRGPLPVSQACHFVRQAALGLQHAHDKGMVHRDVKPQNVMVTKKGQVKILDFGLARFAQEAGGGSVAKSALTAASLAVGTPDYIAPEQARDARCVDGRSDLYSLGCTFYFLLTGRVPFPDGSAIEKLFQHCEESPTPIRQLRPDVPTDVAAVVHRLMAKKPADRFATPAELATALAPKRQSDSDAGGEPVPVAVVVPVATSPIQPAATASRTQALPRRRPRRKRGPAPLLALPGWAVAVIGAAVVLAAAAVTWRALRPTKASEEPAPDRPTAAAGADRAPESGERSPPPRTGRGKDAGAAPPAPRVAAGGSKPVLFVLPSKGYWEPDFGPVRRRLQARGLEVKVASSAETCQPRSGGGGVPVPAEVLLTERVDVASYGAVVFAGFAVDEYIYPGPARPQARVVGDLIADMLRENKPVAAICAGQLVLAKHDVLRNRRAAHSPRFDELADMRNCGAVWVKDFPRPNAKVVKDDSKGFVLTAADQEDAVAFADGLTWLMLGR